MYKPKTHWVKLDVAARIFPCATGKRDKKVFRLFCDLADPVDPIKLQEALEIAIHDFPIFKYTLKKGFFWYYLEESDLEAKVKKEEPHYPAIYEKDYEGLLFNVSYYGNRINVDVYHALADGSGVSAFIRCLVLYYLKLAHPAELAATTALVHDSSITQGLADSFAYHADNNPGVCKNKAKKVYHLRGERINNDALSLIEGTTSVKKILQLSRKHQSTITAVLSTALLLAFAQQMRIKQRKTPVVVSVPINLRNHFSSASSRNFFSVIAIAHCFSEGIPSFEALLP
ncbi:MAG: hypothetical protein RR626_05665, partial [Anaerovoracaceae bacterium]